MGAKFSSSLFIPTSGSTTQIEAIGITAGSGYQDLKIRSIGVGATSTGVAGGITLANGGIISSVAGTVGGQVNVFGGTGTSAGGDLILSGGANATSGAGGACWLRSGQGTGPNSLGAIIFGLATAAAGTQSIANTVTLTGVQNNLSGTNNLFVINPTYADGGVNSSGVMRTLYLNPTINYTAVTKTGSHAALQIDVIETSLPTSLNYLIRLRTGAAGTTDASYVDNLGNWVLNSSGSNRAQNATNGFFYLPQCATGAPSGTPATLLTGAVPAVIGGDNKLYLYYSAAWNMISATGGGVPTVTSTNSTPINLSSSDSGKIYYLDCSGGNIVVNLPAASASCIFWFKKSDSSTGKATVNRAGSDTIDGATSFDVTLQYQTVCVVSDASSKWLLV